MRVLYLLGQDFPDRQTQCIQVANCGVELARLGVPVRLFVRRLLTEDRDEIFARFGLTPEPGFTFHALDRNGLGPLNRWTGPTFAARLAALLGGSCCDDTVVYSRDLPGIEAARLAKIVGRLFGVPAFFEVHKLYGRRLAELYRDDARRKPDPARFLARKARRLRKVRRREEAMLRTVDGLVAINRGLGAMLRERLGPERPIAVIPSAANWPDHVPAACDRDLDVVYCGHLGEIKGVDVLLRAMARLPGRRLRIHGRARREESIARLRRRIDELDLGDRVTLGDWIPPAEVRPLLARARVSALPYRAGWTETTRFVSPLKAYELMAAGVPVVASDLPSLREVIRDGETGLLVPPDAPDALAAALRRVLEDSDLAQRLADGARTEARRHSWAERARRLVEFMRETRDARRGRGS